MRLRLGAVLCLILAFLGAGCRKALVPPTLDNQAPETWIVAAPQDTITTREGGIPVRPQPGKIPVRFHLYWAGSDRDGEVAGYYFAVVETLPVPPEGAISVPALPGPKARDYRFTTKTDSIFIFRASEEVSERQHAFYVYAVDNKGRADATPARFIFSAYDRFPPLAIVDELKAVGTEYVLVGNTVTPVTRTYFVRDSFEISNDHSFPRDTVSANARLTIRWHGEPTIPSTVVTGYRYKLDEPNFNSVDSSVRQVEYNTGVGADRVNPGPKIFTLRAIGQSGWRGESTRWFQMNFAPDSWFAGPDPSLPVWQSITDGNGKTYRFIDFAATGWPNSNGLLQTGAPYAGVTGTMMSPDSLALLPPARVERKTFFEVYNNRLWLRAEDDTVHMNSWVVIPSGGFDRDSPYRVKVNAPLLPANVAGTPVATPTGPNGSPIGFRLRVQVKDPANGVTQPSETTTYPVYDPASVFHSPVINGYWGLNLSGRAYAVLRAEDGDGTVDRRIDQRPGDAVGIVNRIEAGGAGSLDQSLRSKILTFYVNRAPSFRRDNTFRPRVNETYTSRSVVFQLPADDVDQYDFNGGTLNKIGGTPPYSPILRRKIAIIGKDRNDATRTICYVVDGEFFGTGTNIAVTIPDSIARGNITVRLRLCDCFDCDNTAGRSDCPAFRAQEPNANRGRCIELDVPAILNSPTEPSSILGGSEPGDGSAAPMGGSSSRTTAAAPPGPGTPNETGRRKS
jgi:hypothetical protein